MATTVSFTVAANRSSYPSINFPISASLSLDGVVIAEIELGVGETYTPPPGVSFIMVSAAATGLSVTIDGTPFIIEDVFVSGGSHATTSVNNPTAAAIAVTVITGY